MGNGELLLLDDDVAQLRLLGTVLREAGYDVRVATEGPRALALAASHPPELIVLDLQMPRMDGFEVCRRLKDDSKTAGIPVIVISGLEDVEEKVRAFEAGAADYVTKPCEPREVLARVGAHVQLYRLRRELETKQAELVRSRQDLREQNAELQRRNEELHEAERRTHHVFSALASALPGTLLDGKFRLEEKIGSGGFGTVFRAEHVALRRKVAVKVFRPWEGSDTPAALERFRREGATACQIQHPNAVKVTDFGVSGSGIAYLVMELLSGVTVARLLVDEGPLRFARCAEILIPVCDVLAEAHAAGLVHRDIKPENVFLHRTAKGEVVKLLDFGIAKLLLRQPGADDRTLTRHGAFLGTPAYISPERLLGRPYDQRADVYSLGVMLYLLLSLRLPYAAEEGEETVASFLRQLNDPLPPLDVDGLPPGAEDLVMRMLAKESARRPTARQVGAELARLAAPPEKPRGWLRSLQ